MHPEVSSETWTARSSNFGFEVPAASTQAHGTAAMGRYCDEVIASSCCFLNDPVGLHPHLRRIAAQRSRISKNARIRSPSLGHRNTNTEHTDQKNHQRNQKRPMDSPPDGNHLIRVLFGVLGEAVEHTSLLDFSTCILPFGFLFRPESPNGTRVIPQCINRYS